LDSAVSVQIATLQPDFHTKVNFEKSWEYGNTSLHALLTSKKHMTGFLKINFGGFCRSMAFDQGRSQPGAREGEALPEKSFAPPNPLTKSGH